MDLTPQEEKDLSSKWLEELKKKKRKKEVKVMSKNTGILSGRLDIPMYTLDIYSRRNR